MDWRKKFKEWSKRHDFVEVHPDVFIHVLTEVAQLEAELEIKILENKRIYYAHLTQATNSEAYIEVKNRLDKVTAKRDTLVEENKRLQQAFSDLQDEHQELHKERDALRTSILLLLDQVDYTAGNCRVNEMVGAVLPREIIQRIRKQIEGGE